MRSNPPQTARRRVTIGYAATAFVPTAAAALAGAAVTLHRAAWYDGLLQPTFAPSAVALALVAAMADLLVGYAIYRVLCRPDWMPDRPHAMRAFLVLVGLSLGPPLGLGLRSPAVILAAFVVLLLAGLGTAGRFGRVDRRAGLCIWLVTLWTAFLALVAASITIRN